MNGRLPLGAFTSRASIPTLGRTVRIRYSTAVSDELLLVRWQLIFQLTSYL